MKKLLLTTIAALLLATGTAHATEILIAAMYESETDEIRDVSLHQTNLKNGVCVGLVNRFTEQAKNGLPITLTLPAPTFTGIVLAAFCIMPDGSLGARFCADGKQEVCAVVDKRFKHP